MKHRSRSTRHKYDMKYVTVSWLVIGWRIGRIGLEEGAEPASVLDVLVVVVVIVRAAAAARHLRHAKSTYMVSYIFNY